MPPVCAKALIVSDLFDIKLARPLTFLLVLCSFIGQQKIINEIWIVSQGQTSGGFFSKIKKEKSETHNILCPCFPMESLSLLTR